MSDHAVKRVQRMARSVPGGILILDFLGSAEGRERLTQAAARGIPPVTAVSQPLTALLGADALKAAVVKQFCGLVTRAVLAQEGFVPVQSGVRTRSDPVFTAGAVFAKRLAIARKREDELLKRLLDSLSAEEMRWAVPYLRQRIEELQDPSNPTEEDPKNDIT
jgi:hypothetical protein